LSCENLCEFLKKFEMAPMVAWGKLIHEKIQKQEISRHCPFKWKIYISKYQITVFRKHVRSVKFSKLPIVVASQITKFRLTQGFDNWGNSCVSVGQSYRMSRIDRGGLPNMPGCSVQCWFAWEKILRKNWNIYCTRTSFTFLMP
jgi:hypothetical protein